MKQILLISLTLLNLNSLSLLAKDPFVEETPGTTAELARQLAKQCFEETTGASRGTDETKVFNFFNMLSALKRSQELTQIVEKMANDPRCVSQSWVRELSKLSLISANSPSISSKQEIAALQHPVFATTLAQEGARHFGEIDGINELCAEQSKLFSRLALAIAKIRKQFEDRGEQ